MKKWIIISLSLLLMSFLVIRIVNKRFSTLNSERQSYLDQLNYEFSGVIDSVIVEDKNHGLLFFYVTTGKVDVQKEEKLNSQLNFDKKFVFLVDRTDNKFEIATHEPMLCSRGDSLSINTDKNLISIYRQGKQITSEEAMASLRGSRW